MIGLGFVYAVAGAVFAAYAILSATDRRWRNALLWALLAVSFLLGIGSAISAMASSSRRSC